MSAARASQLIEAGLWLRMSGDVEGAKRLFEQALKLDPTSDRARQLLQSPDAPPHGAAVEVVEKKWSMGDGALDEPLSQPDASRPPAASPPRPLGYNSTLQQSELTQNEAPRSSPPTSRAPIGGTIEFAMVKNEAAGSKSGFSRAPPVPAVAPLRPQKDEPFFPSEDAPALGDTPPRSTMEFAAMRESVVPSVAPLKPPGGTLSFSPSEMLFPSPGGGGPPRSTMEFAAMKDPVVPSVAPLKPPGGTMSFSPSGMLSSPLGADGSPRSTMEFAAMKDPVVPSVAPLKPPGGTLSFAPSDMMSPGLARGAPPRSTMEFAASRPAGPPGTMTFPGVEKFSEPPSMVGFTLEPALEDIHETEFIDDGFHALAQEIATANAHRPSSPKSSGDTPAPQGSHSRLSGPIPSVNPVVPHKPVERVEPGEFFEDISDLIDGAKPISSLQSDALFEEVPHLSEPPRSVPPSKPIASANPIALFEEAPEPIEPIEELNPALDINFDDIPAPPPGMTKPPASSAQETAWGRTPSTPEIPPLPKSSNSGFDLIAAAPPAHEQTNGYTLREEVRILLSGAKDLLDLDDHSGAMELISKALEVDPHDADALRLKERSEHTLVAMYESKLGDLNHTPSVILKDDEIIWLNLDHRAGFVLAQIDGSVTFEDLFAVSGMSRIDTARILSQLVEEGVISHG